MRRVLIIDDNEDFRNLIKEKLKEKGFYSDAVGDDINTIKRLIKDEGFEIILLDVNMPKISGFEVLDILKRDYPDIYVIILTGYATPEIVKIAIQSGVNDFITKLQSGQEEELAFRITKAMEIIELKEQLKKEQRLLNIIINLPSLKDRKDDIPLLLDPLATLYSKKKNLCPKAKERLLQQGYSLSHLQELIEVIEKAITLTKGDTILEDAIPMPLQKCLIVNISREKFKVEAKEGERVLEIQFGKKEGAAPRSKELLSWLIDGGRHSEEEIIKEMWGSSDSGYMNNLNQALKDLRDLLKPYGIEVRHQAKELFIEKKCITCNLDQFFKDYNESMKGSVLKKLEDVRKFMNKNFGNLEEYRSEYNFFKKKYEELNEKIQTLKKTSLTKK